MPFFQTASVFFVLFLFLSSGELAALAVRRLRLPNVTGYLLAGILIGPWVLHLVSKK